MKKYHKDQDYSFTLGITVTMELLRVHPEYVMTIYLHSKYQKNEVFNQMEMICQEHKIPIMDNDKIFNTLSDKENCFVIGEFKKYDQRLFDGIHVVLVNPSNQGNLGTIVRSCLGFGIHNIAIISPGVDVYDPKTIRASMGALFNVNVAYFDTFDDYLSEFRGKKIYPFMLQAKTKISDVEFNNSAALVFGPLCFLNRKMYRGGIVMATIIHLFFLFTRNFYIFAFFVLHIICGITFKLLYLQKAEKEVQKIKEKYPKENQEFLQIECQKKGGVDVLSILIDIFVAIVCIVFWSLNH